MDYIKSIYHRRNHLCSDADPAGIGQKLMPRAYHGTSSGACRGSSWSDWNLFRPFRILPGLVRAYHCVGVWEPSLERGQRCCRSGRIHRSVHGRIQSQCSRH